MPVAKYSLADYVRQLKLIIMDEVYFLFGRLQNAAEIIASWFELNEPCSLSAWALMDKVNLSRIWWMMKNNVKIQRGV